MVMADRAGVEVALAEGDGLIVEIEIARCGLVSGGFFPTLKLGGIEVGRDAGAMSGFLPFPQVVEQNGGGGVGIRAE